MNNVVVIVMSCIECTCLNTVVVIVMTYIVHEHCGSHSDVMY